MKHLLILLILMANPTPSPAALRIDQTEQPITTFRRIKKKINRENNTWLIRIGNAVWIALFAWFTITLGPMFLLMFGTGCLTLFLIAEILNL